TCSAWVPTGPAATRKPSWPSPSTSTWPPTCAGASTKGGSSSCRTPPSWPPSSSDVRRVMQDRRGQRLAPVVDQATRAERDAARALGQAQQKLLQSENQLRELQRYLSEYQQQWLTSGRQGVTAQWMVNYQRFLGQLDTAIEQQQRSVEWSRENL